MFTETQLTEIRNYLLSKKLPIDILIEVNDHFISQITDLQREENLSFEEAFEKTKIIWEEEFKLTNSFFLANEPIPKIAKTIFHKRFLKYFINSLYISIPLFFIWVFAVNNFSLKDFQTIFKTTNILFISSLILFIILNIKTILKLKKNKNKVSIIDYQNINNLMLSLTITFQIINGSDGNAKYFYEFFSGSNSKLIPSLISVISPMFLYSFVLINIQMFIQFNKTFKKIVI